MKKLNVKSNWGDADSFYAELTELHRAANIEQSMQINAKLIFLLANHIGDQNILSEALRIAGNESQADKNTAAETEI